ncbi:MAG TPA: DUF302 domain-containing protein [Streptosporangiaceae bacterium]|nr:DUF302 domain-containing protein [Streptosporangiaceae bacterium]
MTSTGSDPGPGIVTKFSPRSVLDTTTLLADLVLSRGLKLFAVIHQDAEARSAGLDLPETDLVIFGDPIRETPVIADCRFAALDVPLRVMIWAQSGQTRISYYPPTAIAARHGLSTGQARRLNTIDALTDAVIAP